MVNLPPFPLPAALNVGGNIGGNCAWTRDLALQGRMPVKATAILVPE